jgi:hypothetical protein
MPGGYRLIDVPFYFISHLGFYLYYSSNLEPISLWKKGCSCTNYVFYVCDQGFNLLSRYKDANKTAFKSSTRLECMMQDYPRSLDGTSRVGFTVSDVLLCY